MIQLKDLNELFNEIEKNTNKEVRFPVRLINIDSFNIWNDLLLKFKQKTCNILNLSDFCQDKDTFPNLRNLMNKINEFFESQNDILIIYPLSEYYRLLKSNTNDLLQIITIEKITKKKVYLPFLFFKDDLESIFSNISRYKTGDISDYYYINDNNSNFTCLSISFFPADFESNHIDLKFGIQNLFKFFEEPIKKFELNISTKFVELIKENFGKINYNTYKSFYNIVKKFIRNNGNIIIYENMANSETWKELAQIINKETDIKDLYIQFFKNLTFNLEILKKINPRDELQKLILFLYLKNNPINNDFLNYCVKISNNYNELIHNIILFPIKIDKIEFYHQRKEIISHLYEFNNDLPEFFWINFNKIDNTKKKIYLLTSITKKENLEILKILRKNFHYIHDLKEIMPEIYNYFNVDPFIYLSDKTNNNNIEFLKNYLSEFKISKFRDELTEKHLELQELWFNQIDAIAFSFQTRGKVLENYKDYYIFWIDGFGLEWLGLLFYHLNQLNTFDISFEIVRANLPTITEANAEWKSDDDVFRELDELAHKKNLDNIERFLFSLKSIQKIAIQINELMKKYDSIIVTSDHGLTNSNFTNLNIINEIENLSPEKYGRYATLLKNIAISHSDFLIDNNKIYIKKYGRFKSQGGATGYIHGGISLEEWLIPVIKISNTAKLDKNYKISIEPTTVKVLTKPIFINIYPDLDYLLVNINNKNISAHKVKENLFSIKPEKLQEGNNKISLIYKNVIIGTFDVTYKPSVIESDMGI